MLYPFMPAAAKQIREFCNIRHVIKLPEHPVQFLKPGHKVNQVSVPPWRHVERVLSDFFFKSDATPKSFFCN